MGPSSRDGNILNIHDHCWYVHVCFQIKVNFCLSICHPGFNIFIKDQIDLIIWSVLFKWIRIFQNPVIDKYQNHFYRNLLFFLIPLPVKILTINSKLILRKMHVQNFNFFPKTRYLL